MATTPDNLFVPTSSSTWNVEVLMGALASSVQAALIKRANYGLGTTGEMNAALSGFPNGAMWFNTTDNREYRRVSGEWVRQGWSGWQNFTGFRTGYRSVPTYPVQFRTQAGEVEFQGRVERVGNSFIADNSYWFGNLPNDIIPPRQELRPVTLGGARGTGRAWVEPSGFINASTPEDATYVDLAEFRYYL